MACGHFLGATLVVLPACDLPHPYPTFREKTAYDALADRATDR